MLILAGISISALTNQGLFIQAKNAKNLTEEKTAEENEILTNYLEQMNEIIGGQVIETVLDGAVVTPINNVTTWLKTAGISKQYSYTTIEQVIADTTCTESLMNNENAMKYLARSTEFADAICASETTMTYLGDSAYVDGTVLNSDSWKQSIKASEYWSLVYASKVVTVYGAASETITIDGYYGSFTTGTNGSCSHVVPIDTITLTGSVSGQSFVRTVANETTEVKVMPEGALYWYGNECEFSGGKWIGRAVTLDANGAGYQIPDITKKTNSIMIKSTNNKQTSFGVEGAISKENEIQSSKYNSIKMNVVNCSTGNRVYNRASIYTSDGINGLITTKSNNTIAYGQNATFSGLCTGDISKVTTDSYIYCAVYSDGGYNDEQYRSCIEFNAVWLE